MNYYTYKIKTKFWKAVFKIGFIKRWYIGNEFLKNPPIIKIKSKPNIKIKDLYIRNTTIDLSSSENVVLQDCKIENTLKLSQYF